MAFPTRREALKIEGTQIIFKSNFEGVEEQYNRAGDRYFNIQLTEEQAMELTANGWNVKTWQPKEEGDDPVFYLKIAVSYKIRPPRCVLITSRGRTPLDEETVEMLDWQEYEFVDVIVNPSRYTVNGRSGVKAYLQTGFFKAYEDDLERKYAHLPEVGLDPVRALPPGEEGGEVLEDSGWLEDEQEALEA